MEDRNAMKEAVGEDLAAGNSRFQSVTGAVGDAFGLIKDKAMDVGGYVAGVGIALGGVAAGVGGGAAGGGWIASQMVSQFGHQGGFLMAAGIIGGGMVGAMATKAAFDKLDGSAEPSVVERNAETGECTLVTAGADGERQTTAISVEEADELTGGGFGEPDAPKMSA